MCLFGNFVNMSSILGLVSKVSNLVTAGRAITDQQETIIKEKNKTWYSVEAEQVTPNDEIKKSVRKVIRIKIYEEGLVAKQSKGCDNSNKDRSISLTGGSFPRILSGNWQGRKCRWMLQVYHLFRSEGLLFPLLRLPPPTVEWHLLHSDGMTVYV